MRNADCFDGSFDGERQSEKEREKIERESVCAGLISSVCDLK